MRMGSVVTFCLVALLSGRGYSEDAARRAACSNEVETLRSLIQKDKDLISAVDKDGYSLLQDAALHNASACIDLLINNGADVKHCSVDGLTPLHCAIIGGASKEVIAILLDKGADITARSKPLGNTALYYAADNGRTDLIAYLIERGADVNVRNASGRTPLHATAALGYTNNIALLVAKGADVNAKDAAGETPLDMAKTMGRVNVVAALRSFGAKDPEADIRAIFQEARKPSHQQRAEDSKTAPQEQEFQKAMKDLASVDPSVRYGAVWTLGRLNDSRAVPALEEATKDADSNVSRAAAANLKLYRDFPRLDE